MKKEKKDQKVNKDDVSKNEGKLERFDKRR